VQRNDSAGRPVDPDMNGERGAGRRGGRLRLAALSAALAASVFGFGAFVLPRAATDSSLEHLTSTDGASYAIVVDLRADAFGGCDRADEATDNLRRET
jgi:hypothetical protein